MQKWPFSYTQSIKQLLLLMPTLKQKISDSGLLTNKRLVCNTLKNHENFNSNINKFKNYFWRSFEKKHLHVKPSTNLIWNSKNVFRFYVIFMELSYFLLKIFFFFDKSQERFCLRLNIFLLMSINLLHRGLLDGGFNISLNQSLVSIFSCKF